MTTLEIIARNGTQTMYCMLVVQNREPEGRTPGNVSPAKGGTSERGPVGASTGVKTIGLKSELVSEVMAGPELGVFASELKSETLTPWLVLSTSSEATELELKLWGWKP